ncbi:MAG: virulence factor [Thiothrix sp.]|nr:virulence factor [Thiothrix sp.]HPE62302.1 virulence factor [Thiolinea sp.]
MPQKIVVYWRDIPSQVTIQQGRNKGKWLMSQRFQEAIDRAAIRAGKADTDSYVAEWRRETSDHACDGELEACARAEVEQLESAFPEERLNRMVKNGGLATDTADPAAPGA